MMDDPSFNLIFTILNIRPGIRSNKKIYGRTAPDRKQSSIRSPCTLHPTRSNLTLDQDLDRPSLRTVRTRIERADRIFEAEPMRDQPLHVKHAALHEADGARPGVGVAVLELEVDFLGAKTHEWDLHVWLANADNEDFAAEFDGVDLGVFGQHNVAIYELGGSLRMRNAMTWKR